MSGQDKKNPEVIDTSISLMENSRYDPYYGKTKLNGLNLTSILHENSMSLSGGDNTKLRKKMQVSLFDLFKSNANLSSNYTMVSYSKMNYEIRKCIVYSLILLSACGTFFMGYNEAVFDTMEEEMKEVFEWKDEEGDFLLTMISTAITLGALLGAFFSGLLTNYIGRLKSFLLLDIISIIGTVLTIIVNPYVIIAGRTLIGFSLGGYTYVARLYMAEMSPIQLRGQNIAVIEVFYMVGIQVAYSFGFGIKLNDWWWKFMFGFNFLICGLHFFISLFAFNYDTPMYTYLTTKNMDLTKKILSNIYKNEDDINQVAKEIKRVSKEKEEQNKITYLQLFGEKYRPRMFVCLALIIFSIFIGIDALIYFSASIFLDYTSREKAELFTNLLGGAQLISSVISVSFVEHLGRKYLLAFGHGIYFFTLIATGILFYLTIEEAYIYLFGVMICLNAITVNPVTNIYLTDVLPEKGLALSYTTYYICKLILTSTFKMIVNGLGYHGQFGIYAGFTLIAVLYVLFKVKETQGKTIAQLDSLYN